MKTSFQKILVRWYHASDKPLPGWLERACGRDPALARERDAETALSERFHQDVRPARHDASPFLAGRVARALNEPQPARSSPARARLSWVVAAGAACALALVVSRWNHFGKGGDFPPDPTHAGLVAASTEPPRSASAASAAQLAADVRKEAGWVNPLDQEINHVIADARGALRFLATSFLPTGALEKKPG